MRIADLTKTSTGSFSAKADMRVSSDSPRSSTDAEFSLLKFELSAELRAEIDADLGAFKTKIKADLDAFKAKTKVELDAFKAEMNAQFEASKPEFDSFENLRADCMVNLQQALVMIRIEAMAEFEAELAKVKRELIAGFKSELEEKLKKELGLEVAQEEVGSNQVGSGSGTPDASGIDAVDYQGYDAGYNAELNPGSKPESNLEGSTLVQGNTKLDSFTKFADLGLNEPAVEATRSPGGNSSLSHSSLPLQGPAPTCVSTVPIASTPSVMKLYGPGPSPHSSYLLAHAPSYSGYDTADLAPAFCLGTFVPDFSPELCGHQNSEYQTPTSTLGCEHHRGGFRRSPSRRSN